MTDQNELPPEIIRDDIASVYEDYESLWKQASEAFEEYRRLVKAARQKGIEV